MLYLRSFLFNVAWYINILLHMILQTPFYFFLSHEQAIKVPKRWTAATHWLHRVMAGTKMKIIGEENMPQDGCVVACKHQSTWEFYAVNSMVRDAAFVLKSELMKIPFFGWYVAKLRHIPIRRGDKGRAMRKMISVAKDRIAEGRQIIIFPEGTRKTPGEEPDYRYGVTRMYMELNCPVVPVALNSGLYWPRRKFLRHPGTIRTKICQPIMPGLSAQEFSAELERQIEEACDELYLMASQDDVRPPLSEAVLTKAARAKKRLEKAKQK